MKKLIFAAVILVFLLSSCSLLPFGNNNDTSAAVAALQATRDAQNSAATANATQAQQAPTQAPPTEAPTIAPPTETATAVPPTATPTEVPMVKAVANVNANCRLGPDKSFALVEVLNSGISGEVNSQVNTNGLWWNLTTEDGKECWVLADNVSISGDTSIIPTVIPPNTPTPVPPPSWAGSWHMRMSGTGSAVETSATAFDVEFNQTGNQISYYYVLWGISFAGFGTVSADGMTVTGDVSSATWSGRFIFKRNPANLNQFQGKWVYGYTNNDGEFCGYRQNAGYPVPCRP